MNLEKILEKYPFLKPNKDGLISLKEIIRFGEFVHHGFLIDDYFIPYSEYFYYQGTSIKGILYFRFCGCIEYLQKEYPHLDCFMRFDLDKIEPRNSYIQGDLGGGGRGLPSFDIGKLLSLENNVVSEKIRRNNEFDKIMGNYIERTEFFYDAQKKSLQTEEITTNMINNNYFHRYFHTEFNKETKLPKHFDGALLLYTDDEKNNRDKTSLDKRLKNAHEYIKLFRIDGSIIDLDIWINFVMMWYINNELVEEWLDTEGYNNRYADILKINIDY